MAQHFIPIIGETYYYLNLTEKNAIISIHTMPIVYDGNENTLSDYNLFRNIDNALKAASEIKSVLINKPER